jgi:hypothetical protein
MGTRVVATWAPYTKHGRRMEFLPYQKPLTATKKKGSWKSSSQATTDRNHWGGLAMRKSPNSLVYQASRSLQAWGWKAEETPWASIRRVMGMCVAKYKKKTHRNKGDMPPVTAVLLLLVLLGAAMLLWFVRVGRRLVSAAKEGTT